jgi:DNA polymerase-3 subunit delta'
VSAVTGWERIEGQDDAVARSQRAAARPTHAYLLVGPPGSGVEVAARCFAAHVIAPDDERAFDLALRGVHPDVVEVDPAATQIRVEDAQTVLDEAYRSPVEGARKVILVFEAERLNEQAANKLLKTLEEPPETALIVLVTAGADQLLATIRSRCQRVDFAYRPRVLDARVADVHRAFVDAALAVDGSGAGVTARVADVQNAMQAAIAHLEQAQAADVAELTGELEASGYPDRVVRTQLRRLEEQQKRAHRHARTALLVEGVTALETVYRDALAGPAAPARNPDRRTPSFEPRSCNRALDACREARQALSEFNPNETLLLERLFLHLPAVPR